MIMGDGEYETSRDKETKKHGLSLCISLIVAFLL